MLQRLEPADRQAELLAGLQVLHRGRVQRIHEADRLGAQRSHGAVGDSLDQRIADRACRSRDSGPTFTPAS